MSSYTIVQSKTVVVMITKDLIFKLDNVYSFKKVI